MPSFKKCFSVAVLATSLCASASWAGGFQFPHRARQAACPTAVETPQTHAISWGENKDVVKAPTTGDKSKTQGGVAPTANGHSDLQIIAVKKGAAGKQATEAGKGEAAAGAK